VAGDNSTRAFVARRLPALLLGCLILAHGLGNWLWLRAYSDPVLGEVTGWDTRWHLRNTMVFGGLIWQAARSGRGPAHVIKEVVSHLNSTSYEDVICPNWPRLMYLVAAIPCLIFGPSGRVVEMANLFWLSLLLLSTYLIGAACRDRWTGLLAAGLVSLTPAVFCLSRRFELDFALGAAVACACWALIRTEGFTRLGWSVAFGVICGLGLMVKAQFLIFLLPPCLVLVTREPISRLVARVRRRRLEERSPGRLWRPCALALLSAGLAGAVSSAWWRGLFSEYAPALAMLVNPGVEPGFKHPFDPLFYVGSIIEGATPFLSIAIAAGVLLALRAREAQHRALLLLWALGAFVIFSLRFSKQGRFIFPVLPALALLAAIGWRRIFDGSSRRLRAMAVVIVTLVGLNGLAQYLGISFAAWGEAYAWSWSAPVQRRLLGPDFVPGRSWARLWKRSSEERRREEHKLLDTVDRFIERTRSELAGRPPRIGIVGHSFFASLGYPYALRMRRYFAFRVFRSRPEEAVEFEGTSDIAFYERPEHVDYVIAMAPGAIDRQLETQLKEQQREQIAASACPACAPREWRRLSGRIQYIRATFTRVVAESEWIDPAVISRRWNPGKLRLYLLGRQPG
jgi:hypothetical protein